MDGSDQGQARRQKERLVRHRAEHCTRGIGTTLLHGLQSEAAAAGKPLRLHVERFNPALRLYERLGFQQIEDRGVYLFMEWRG